MKFISTSLLLLFCSTSFSQWTRVQQLPSTDIFSLYKNDNILYAGGKNLVYYSRDKGQTWDSTKPIAGFSMVDNLIVHKNELYASSYSVGIYKSDDNGNTWKNISAGIFPFVSDLTEWFGDLYAATLGNSVYKLDPVHLDNWTAFNTGLSSLSANLNSIAGNNNSLIAGTLANGLYDLLPSNSTIWNELFLLGQISPNEGAYDIITAHDSLILAGRTGSSYLSTDNGINWNKFGNKLSSTFTSLLNAQQAFLSARNVFDGITNNSFFSYIKKDSLQGTFKQFSAVTDHFSYRMEIIGNKLWDASSKGLFYMSLSDLPGISGVDDTIIVTPLPVRFISFHLECGDNKILIKWKTASEQNVSHYDVEESADGSRWSVIGMDAAIGNGNIESTYAFIKNNPAPKNFFRVAEYDLDGRVHYSEILRSECFSAEKFSIFPNPSSGKVFVDLNASSTSKAIIRIYDTKGALVKQQSTVLMQGNNRVVVDLNSFARGVYEFQISTGDEQDRRAILVMKH